MLNMSDDFLNKVNEYYSGKIKTHGPISEGVDWNGIDSHTLRFEQLIKVIEDPSYFSVLDYGCGYGALNEYLIKEFNQFDYHGYDISEEMLSSAKEQFPKQKDAFFSQLKDGEVFDYVISNGLFNVKLDTEESVWNGFIEQTIGDFNRLSSKGFSFNILTSYSDLEKQKPHLHYADPMRWFDYCKRNFSRNVALLHDYELYEFTILVKK